MGGYFNFGMLSELTKPFIYMAKADKQGVKTSREQLMSVASERFPDRRFKGQIGQDGQEGQDELEDSILEIVQDYSTKQGEYDANNKKLHKLLMDDPSSAEFLQKWLETGDPRTALVEVFGEELGISEEGQKKFKAQLDGWRERRDANNALEAESETNWNNSLAALEEWGNGKGLSLEQKRDVMLRLLAITFNGMESKYSPDDFELALKAINHDKDVDNAREEGMIAGKNAKIATVKRGRAAAAGMPPVSNGGQGMRGREPKPETKQESVWAGIE